MNKSILLTLLIASSFAGKGQFKLSAEIRPRTEYRHGFQALVEQDQDPAFFIEQRTRLNAEYWKDQYAIKIVLQDVRTWGSQSQLVNNGGNLTAIHEAWGKLKLSENSSLKVGRQEIILDDSRIFGNVAWAQQARSHDALLFETGKDNFTLQLAAAYNQDGVQSTTNFYSVPKSYKTLQFLWMKKKWTSITASMLILNNGLQSGTPTAGETYFSQTLGGNIDYIKGKLQPAATFYFQTGKDGVGNDLSTYQFQVDLTYKTGKSSLMIGYEVLSGNDELSSTTENNSFNPFYGTNHKFNGLMDYFYVGNHNGSVGLRDLFVEWKTPIAKWQSTIAMHYFNSHADQLDPDSGGAADKYLGSEIDLVVSRKLYDDVLIHWGYSQMFGSSSMEILKGGDAGANNNWAWVMLTIKPTFFEIDRSE
ncbi:alginate export family protein [Ekhidna sp.]|uniref:alginate export family protein n=1 Tax=Ekhidna sp. TaxID=2608089 RepID=UPI0032975229